MDPAVAEEMSGALALPSLFYVRERQIEVQ